MSSANKCYEGGGGGGGKEGELFVISEKDLRDLETNSVYEPCLEFDLNKRTIKMPFFFKQQERMRFSVYCMLLRND